MVTSHIYYSISVVDFGVYYGSGALMTLNTPSFYDTRYCLKTVYDQISVSKLI